MDGSPDKASLLTTDRQYLENEDTPMMKVMKSTTMGFVAGTVWGTVIATWHDVPRVERNVALPGLLRTLKLMGNHGLTFAAIGGVFIGVEQLMEHFRMKRDLVNGSVGAFVAGASILGYRGKSISTGIKAGSALAFTSAFVDYYGQTMFNNHNSQPVTVVKRPRSTAD